MRLPGQNKQVQLPSKARLPRQYQEDETINYSGAVAKVLILYETPIFFMVVGVFIPYLVYGPQALTIAAGQALLGAVGAGDLFGLFTVVAFIRAHQKQMDLQTSGRIFGKWTLRLPEVYGIRRIYFHKMFEVEPLSQQMLTLLYKSLNELPKRQKDFLLKNVYRSEKYPTVGKTEGKDELEFQEQSVGKQLATGVHAYIYRLIDHQGGPPKKGLTHLLYLSRAPTGRDLYKERSDSVIYNGKTGGSHGGWERSADAEDFDWRVLTDDMRVTWPNGEENMLPVCIAAGDNYVGEAAAENLSKPIETNAEQAHAVAENGLAYLTETLAQSYLSVVADNEALRKGQQFSHIELGDKRAGNILRAVQRGHPVPTTVPGKSRALLAVVVVVVVASVFAAVWFIISLPKPGVHG